MYLTSNGVFTPFQPNRALDTTNLVFKLFHFLCPLHLNILFVRLLHYKFSKRHQQHKIDREVEVSELNWLQRSIGD